MSGQVCGGCAHPVHPEFCNHQDPGASWRCNCPPERTLLDRVYRWVQGNIDVWSDSDDPYSRAFVDSYQKVLNMIDTGNPLERKP